VIDIQLLRENPENVKDSQIKRGLDAKIVDKILSYDKKWRKTLQDIDKLRQKRNDVNRNIAELKKSGKPVTAKIKEMQKLCDEIFKGQKNQDKFLKKRDELRLKLPNLLDDDVPAGKNENDNKELRNWGKIPNFNFQPKAHADLIEDLNVADMDSGAIVAGARFYYLKNELVILNLALQKFALDFLTNKGFIPVQPPYMLNRASVGGSVSLADFEESIYKIEKEDLYLIGTSEHALAAMHQNQTINVDKPLKYAGISSCFRKEAGSHGKDTKGIFRVHRFEKIEQFVFCNPKDEDEIFNEIIGNQEELFKTLQIPYRIVFLCSGDTGGSMSKTYDLEGWFPAQNRYRELGSTSTAKTYQAVKQKTKYLTKENKKEPVYTINGTAMTVQRTMCCILENYQKKNGSVEIPTALIPYMNGIKKISPVKK